MGAGGQGALHLSAAGWVGAWRGAGGMAWACSLGDLQAGQRLTGSPSVEDGVLKTPKVIALGELSAEFPALLESHRGHC